MASNLKGFLDLVVPFYDYVIYMSNNLVHLDRLIYDEVVNTDIYESINEAIGAEYYIYDFIKKRRNKRPQYPHAESFLTKLEIIKGYIKEYEDFYNSFKDFESLLRQAKGKRLELLLNWPIRIVVPYYISDYKCYLRPGLHVPYEIIDDSIISNFLNNKQK